MGRGAKASEYGGLFLLLWSLQAMSIDLLLVSNQWRLGVCFSQQSFNSPPLSVSTLALPTYSKDLDLLPSNNSPLVELNNPSSSYSSMLFFFVLLHPTLLQIVWSLFEMLHLRLKSFLFVGGYLNSKSTLVQQNNITYASLSLSLLLIFMY